jgi:hypothetical protein
MNSPLPDTASLRGGARGCPAGRSACGDGRVCLRRRPERRLLAACGSPYGHTRAGSMPFATAHASRQIRAFTSASTLWDVESRFVLTARVWRLVSKAERIAAAASGPNGDAVAPMSNPPKSWRSRTSPSPRRWSRCRGSTSSTGRRSPASTTGRSTARPRDVRTRSLGRSARGQSVQPSTTAALILSVSGVSPV